MKNTVKTAGRVLAGALTVLTLAGCDSFYELFEDNSNNDEGIYFVIFDSSNTDEEIAAIPDVRLMKGDLNEVIKEYNLSFEITIAFDLETDNEASLSCYYYHNMDDEDASDYCKIGSVSMGTYELADAEIIFHFESEGYNLAFYQVGEDYLNNPEFMKMSYSEDGSCGVWAYEFATWEYESTAIIDEAVTDGMPETVVFEISGNKIVSWHEG